MKQLKSGWELNDYNCEPYHFEHIARNEAELLEELKDEIHVVETINWTIANAKTGSVHFNKYLATSLRAAIGLAVQIEMDASEIAEEVVGIRRATQAESDAFSREWHRLSSSEQNSIKPEAIPTIQSANELN